MRMRYRVYAGAIDGAQLDESSDDKSALVRSFEEFSRQHDIVTKTLKDTKTDELLTEELSQVCHRAYNWAWE